MDLPALSYPELTTARTRVIAALAEASAGGPAATALFVLHGVFVGGGGQTGLPPTAAPPARGARADRLDRLRLPRPER